MNAMSDALHLGRQGTVTQVRARPLLGTVVEIAATGVTADAVQAAIGRAFDEVALVHALMSYHDADSEVSRINRFGFARPVPVHEHTWRVLSAARAMAEASGGLFDISIAPTLTRLGFLPRHPNFPRISGQGDWRHVELLSGQRVRLTRRLRIDVSGIAKGYAVDLAVHVLQNAGMSAGRVNAGGDLRLFGATAQTLHVRVPHSPTHVLPLIELTEGAAATSAAYFSRRRHAGRMVAPLIHPHTRTPSSTQRSITVLAQTCLHADALTKVVHADPARAVPVLARFNARALMVEHDPVTGGCRVFDTGISSLNKWRAHWGVQTKP
jgi:thiamine biosynthesis lipoprotein